MTSHAFSTQLSEAVLESVQHGAYPASEEIISATLPPSAFSEALKLLNQARDEVKAQIRTSSKDSAQDIDGWILQAKQLREDIETVQASSHDILITAQRAEELRQQSHEANNKLCLLEEEVAFIGNVSTILQKVFDIRKATTQIQRLVDQGELLEAIDLTIQIEQVSAIFQSDCIIRAVAVLKSECKELRQEIGTALTQEWHELIRADGPKSTVSLPHHPQFISTVADAMEKLGLLDEHIVNFGNELEAVIIMPRLQLQDGLEGRLLVVESDCIKITESPFSDNLHHLFDDLGVLIGFLQMHLPPSIIGPLSQGLAPNLVEKLISVRLSTTIPDAFAALHGLDSTCHEVFAFSETMHSYGWPGAARLQAWVNSIPELWVEKRQRISLDQLRRLLKRGYGHIKPVERVETQVISQQDQLFTGTANNDVWNGGWSEQEESNPVGIKYNLQNAEDGHEENDVSAWGLDDQGDEAIRSRDAASSAESEDEDDAWGWGDDTNTEAPPRETVKPSCQGVNGRGSERAITLREIYNITALPIGIRDLISSIISDLDELGVRRSNDAPAIAALSAVPSLLLVMYRASASNFYSINNKGNMFLYNDCLWLVDQLGQLKRIQKHGPHFDSDMVALEAFGKRSYGKEMESQRSIIKDLLDGAQGLISCTEPPFSQQCDLAISTIVDRLRDTHKQWRGVLSYSALLQSVGSLLSTVVDKITIDIQDMSDISEPESQCLTAYCKRITALEDLFLPQQPAQLVPGGEDPVPLTAVYVPGWFKFQFLSEILDSSLVDIKYLWTDGGLKLEYDTEEVVDLIEALFVDSEHRRRAIGELRRSSGR
ncbi:MAG: hypothetical protein Q9182_000701 [Xanthomendoza sp. 2 TL-2023]